MTRVLVVGHGPPARGGIPSFLAALLDSDLATRHELELVNLTPPRDGRRGGDVSAANVARTLRDAREVFRRARDHDVVHLHTSLGPVTTTARAGLLALAARSRRSRVVLHAHGGLVEVSLASWLRRRALALSLAPVDVVVAVSEATARRLAQAMPRSEVVQIDNGIHLDRFAPAGRTGDGPPRVLYAGYLTPRKGLLDLFEASSLLAAEGIEHELWVVGGAADDETAAAAAVRDAAPPHAHLTGPVEPAAMPAVYRDADVFCLPSWWEAMPMSVLEAMASSLPVVATAVGDVARLVADGETGFVVPPREPAALAGALRSLLTDPQQRAAMGAAGRERVRERWGIDRTAEELDAVFARVAARRARRRRGPTT